MEKQGGQGATSTHTPKKPNPVLLKRGLALGLPIQLPHTLLGQFAPEARNLHLPTQATPLPKPFPFLQLALLDLSA